jgi:hypothetical protein
MLRPLGRYAGCAISTTPTCDSPRVTFGLAPAAPRSRAWPETGTKPFRRFARRRGGDRAPDGLSELELRALPSPGATIHSLLGH